MPKHAYAIKYQGKTLGIKDAEQLLRLIDTRKVTLSDKIFLLDSKRWMLVGELPEVVGELSLPAVNGQDKAAGREFASLINELYTGSGADSSTQLPGSSTSQRLALSEAFRFETEKTIHRLSTPLSRSARLTETMTAVKAPATTPAFGPGRATLLAGAVALFLGLAVGYYGLTRLVNHPVAPAGKSAPALLQASGGTQADQK